MDGSPRSFTRLVLIRHGESRASVDQVVGGHKGCKGLSEHGARQVLALADRLSSSGELATVHALVASILPRAVETALLLAPALGFAPEQVVRDCDLCELHPGECDGMTWEEFAKTYGDPDMGRNPYVRLSPGGESVAEFQLRAGRALTGLVAKHRGQTVVVACHGGIVVASMVAFLGLPAFGRSVYLTVDNTSITEWLVPAPGSPDTDRDTAALRLVRFNDAAHLARGPLPH